MLSTEYLEKLERALAVGSLKAAGVSQVDDVWRLPTLLLQAQLSADQRKELLCELEQELRLLVGAHVLAGPAPGIRKLFVSYASEDADAVERWRSTSGGQRAFLDRDIGHGELWQARLLFEILRADQLVVMWSASAAGSVWVEREARFARDVQTIRLGQTSFTNRGAPYLSVTCLDVTPLPAFLSDVQADQARIAMQADPWTVFATLAAVAVALWLSRRGDSPVFPALLAALGLLLAINQYMSHVSRNALRGSLDRGSTWLRDADVWAIITQAEVVLDRIYGRRLFSVRSLATSAFVSLCAGSPALVAMVRFARRSEYGIAFPGMSPASPVVFALGLLSFLLVSMSFDFLSLLGTRVIIGWIRRKQRLLALLLGILADLAVAGLCVLVPLRAAGFTQGTQARELDILRVLIDEYDSPWGWFAAVTQSVWQLLSGQIRLERLPYTLFPTVFVVAAACLSSAIFPSLVHLSLLFAGAISHRLKHGPLRWLSLLLGTLHRDRRAPLVYVHVVAVLVVAGLSLLAHEGLAAGNTRPIWVQVPGRDVCLAKQELTQAQWRSIWDINSERSRAWGLPREPAVFVGDDRPIETVSFCEALRFCNLWSLAEGLAPRYCEASPTANSSFAPSQCKDAPEMALRLTHCEAGQAIERSRDANGYALPEWPDARSFGPGYRHEPIKRNVVAVGWFTANASFHTHAAGTFPNPLLTFPLDDFWGNVDELMDYPPLLRDADEQARFGVAARGGSWFGSGYTRVAARATSTASYYKLDVRNLSRTFRSGQTGFRPLASQDAQGCHVTATAEGAPRGSH